MYVVYNLHVYVVYNVHGVHIFLPTIFALLHLFLLAVWCTSCATDSATAALISLWVCTIKYLASAHSRVSSHPMIFLSLL